MEPQYRYVALHLPQTISVLITNEGHLKCKELQPNIKDISIFFSLGYWVKDNIPVKREVDFHFIGVDRDD